MSKFEALCQAYAQARQDYYNYRDEIRQFAWKLVNGMVVYLGIPEDCVRFVSIGRAGEIGKWSSLPDVMHLDSEDNCWHLGVEIILYEDPQALSRPQPVLMLLRMKKEGDTFVIKTDSRHPGFHITSDAPDEFHALYDYVFEAIQEMFRENLVWFATQAAETRRIGFD